MKRLKPIRNERRRQLCRAHGRRHHERRQKWFHVVEQQGRGRGATPVCLDPDYQDFGDS
ncbi:MAG: hypothetical protein JJU10_08255 [Idiomarina sp.]|nr:hypothetical protein [Idiomarina sp.]